MKSETARRAAAVALLALGLGLCALGWWRGEAATVLTKAVRVCMECIGLG